MPGKKGITLRQAYLLTLRPPHIDPHILVLDRDISLRNACC